MENSPKARPSSFPEEIWTAAFNRVSQQIRPYFVRTESHQRALAYLQGLMSQASRKNGWQVAEEMGETTCAGYFAYPFYDQKVNGHAGNPNVIYLMRR